MDGSTAGWTDGWMRPKIIVAIRPRQAEVTNNKLHNNYYSSGPTYHCAQGATYAKRVIHISSFIFEIINIASDL